MCERRLKSCVMRLTPCGPRGVLQAPSWLAATGLTSKHTQLLHILTLLSLPLPNTHTHTCMPIGLLCLKTAKSGGKSELASSITIYNELLKRDPKIIEALVSE